MKNCFNSSCQLPNTNLKTDSKQNTFQTNIKFSGTQYYPEIKDSEKVKCEFYSLPALLATNRAENI